MASDGEGCPSTPSRGALLRKLPVACCGGNSQGPGGSVTLPPVPSAAHAVPTLETVSLNLPHHFSTQDPQVGSGLPSSCSCPGQESAWASPPFPASYGQAVLGTRPVNLGRWRDLLFAGWMGKGHIPPRWGHRTQRAPPAPKGGALQMWSLPAGPQIHSRNDTCTRNHQLRYLGGGCHWPSFIDGKCGPERLRDLPRVTEPALDGGMLTNAGLQPLHCLYPMCPGPMHVPESCTDTSLHRAQGRAGSQAKPWTMWKDGGEWGWYCGKNKSKAVPVGETSKHRHGGGRKRGVPADGQ